MSWQGRGRRHGWGITAKWRGGRQKGRLGRIERSLCLSPVPEFVSLLTGVMLTWLEGKGEDGFVTK